jgi:secondary thiamine-phosphate synthase enzyme
MIFVIFADGAKGAIMLKTISIKTSGRTEMVDVTSQVQDELTKSGIKDGRLTLYVPHTTAAVTINEGADPAVKGDILMVLNQMEGNSPAHVKASLVGPAETLLVSGGRLVLGTWQKIFFCEFDGPRNRKLHLQVSALQD